MGRPKQAVILAGGLGTRLRPLSNSIPKPLVPFHGKPFLDYLLEQLKQQGFERVLLLTGYKAEQIEKHVGDGSRMGLDVRCLATPVEDDTGARIKKARIHLDNVFFLMYCDNYLPFDFESMWQQFDSSGLLAQIAVYGNRDGHTRDNVKVVDGAIAIYDKSRKSPNLSGVDVGFSLLNKSVLDLVPDGNVNFEAHVYPVLAEQKQLGAYATDHRYYSVGDFARLPETVDFLKFHTAILLDRDGVLNVKAPRAQYVTSPEEFIWIDGSLEALALLSKAGFRVGIITNQAGIARGMMTEQELKHVHGKMLYDIQCAGGHVDAIYHCPHHWDEGCTCRKPEPGMLFQAQRGMRIDLSKAWFVGDDERDVEAGRRAKCRTLLVDQGNTLLDVVKQYILP